MAMKEKEICQYCANDAKFDDVGLNADTEYSVVGVCDKHLLNYGVS